MGHDVLRLGQTAIGMDVYAFFCVLGFKRGTVWQVAGARWTSQGRFGFSTVLVRWIGDWIIRGLLASIVAIMFRYWCCRRHRFGIGLHFSCINTDQMVS